MIYFPLANYINLLIDYKGNIFLKCFKDKPYEFTVLLKKEY